VRPTRSIVNPQKTLLPNVPLEHLNFPALRARHPPAAARALTKFQRGENATAVGRYQLHPNRQNQQKKRAWPTLRATRFKSEIRGRVYSPRHRQKQGTTRGRLRHIPRKSPPRTGPRRVYPTFICASDSRLDRTRAHAQRANLIAPSTWQSECLSGGGASPSRIPPFSAPDRPRRQGGASVLCRPQPGRPDSDHGQ